MAPPNTVQSPYYPFRYDPENHLLICTECGYACNNKPSSAKDHLRDKHNEVSNAERSAIAAKVSELDVCCNFKEVQARRPNLDQVWDEVPGLKVINNGYRCNKCLKVIAEWSSMDSHLRKEHKITTVEVTSNLTHPVPVCTLFSSPVNYVEIKPRPFAPEVQATDPKTEFMKTQLAVYHLARDQQVVRRSYIPGATHHTDITPWLERTKWIYHLGDLEYRHLVYQTRLLDLNETHLVHGCELLEGMLDDYHESAQETPKPLRMLLYSRRTDVAEPHPMQFNVNDKTWEKTKKLSKQLFCYLMRLFRSIDQRLTLSPK